MQQARVRRIPAAPFTVASAAPAVASASTFSKSKVEISCFFPSSESVKSPFFKSRIRLPCRSRATTLTSTSSDVTCMRYCGCCGGCGASWASATPIALNCNKTTAIEASDLLNMCVLVFMFMPA